MGKAPMAEEEGDVVKALFNVIEFVGSLPNYQWMQRKECFNLVRRIKQLVPMLEEVRELETGPLPAEAEAFLGNLKKLFVSAKKLLRCCHDGSKIYLVRISTSFFFFNLPSFLSSFVGFSGQIKLNDRTDLLRASGGASL